jgi:hypothetical protein
MNELLAAQCCPLFDTAEVRIERCELDRPAFCLYLDLAETRTADQCVQALRSWNREKAVQLLCPLGSMASDNGTDAGEERAFGRRGNADCRPSTVAENPMELGQAARRIIEEHQPELTDHGIKAVMWESQEAAERFYSGEWLTGIRGRYGTEPKITYFETVALTDKGTGRAGGLD